MEVPAGPLDGALLSLGRQTNLRLIYPTSLTSGLRTPGASGNLSPDAALQQILSGTGLTYRFTTGNSVTIEAPPAAGSGAVAPDGTIVLDTVTLEGSGAFGTGTIGTPPPPYAGGQVAAGARLGVLGNRSIFDVPFNVTSYTDKTIEDQQARSLADVVANDSSVRSILPRGSGGEQFFIRGLRVFPNDVAFDGLFGITDFRRQPIEGIERVEILKGPSALLSGTPPQGSIGGGINFIPKRAPDVDVNRVTASYASESQFGTHVDISRRFGPEKEWGIRFNGAYRDGNTEVDNNEVGFGMASLGLDYRGERVRVAADLGHHKQEIDGLQDLLTVRTGIAIPAAPDGNGNASQPWEFADAENVFGTIRGEFDLTAETTLYAAYGQARTEEYFKNGTLQISNARGDFSQTFGLFPGATKGETGEAGLRTKFETGPLTHHVTASAVGLWRESKSLSVSLPSPISSNIYDPIRISERSSAGFRDEPVLASLVENRGLALSDTVSLLDERLLLIVGGRLQDVGTKNFSATTGLQTSDYSASAFTPAVGVVVKPLEGLSLYANYIEGLQAGSIAPTSAVNAGEALEPFVSEQVEVGAKYDFGSFGLSLSAFEIVQPSAFTDPTTNRFGVEGEQRNRGIELNVFGEPATGLRLLGGVAIIDAELTQTLGGINDGKTAPGVPDLQLNLYGEYDLPFDHLSGLTITGRIIHTTSQFYDQANTQEIPDWTRFDFGARYVFERDNGKPITMRASVENVFDEDYFASTGGGFLTQGSPRTFLLSTTVDF